MSNIEVNIENAFSVVKDTYYNINKLFSAIDKTSIENGYINIIKDQKSFLRWKSENDPFGWLINSFIKLYQKKDTQRINDDSQSDEIRNDEFIYALEFNFENSPILKIAKFSHQPEGWTSSPAVSEHWQFYWPLKTNNSPDFDFLSETDITKSTPKNETVKHRYKKLNYVKYKEVSLVNITSENFVEVVFGGFNEL